eukprot:snap_masked-scaffold_17-processed-gene-5.14-mRNA-1 protein AED:1.00 eAED:1.00 QI:0/0/0/0/1/1/3/0/106
MRTFVGFCYHYDSQEFCSFILKTVSVGLAKKLRRFGTEYSVKTEADFYIINKLLWNVGTNFEDIVYSWKHFKENKKLKKHFLWELLLYIDLKSHQFLSRNTKTKTE